MTNLNINIVNAVNLKSSSKKQQVIACSKMLHLIHIATYYMRSYPKLRLIGIRDPAKEP